EQFKAKRAVLLVDETSSVCAAVASAFVKEWRSSDRVAHSWNAAAEESASGLVERLKKVEAEVVLFAGSSGDFVTARNVLAMGKLSLPLVFGGEPVEWQRLERGPDVGKEVFAGAVHVASRFDEEGKKFLSKYKEKYHEDADVDACAGFEMIQLLASKIR